MYTLKRLYHLFIRLLVALVAAHFVVVHSAEETWLELFTKDYYYYSLCYSTIIAILLIESVYFATKIINFKLGDPKQIGKRIRIQFIFGFCLTGLNAFLLAMILFYLNGENIFDSGYFEKLYIFILLFIFTVNVVYLLYFEYNRVSKLRYHRIHFDHMQLINLKARAYAEDANLPAVIFHEDKAYFAIDFKGIKTSWPNTIEETMKLLQTENYFQINRKGIVHRAAVLSFSTYLGKSLKIELNIPCPIEMITSRRKTVFFKEWIKQ